MKKSLVVGATGFIGSDALDHLRDTSYVDALPKGVDTGHHAAVD